MKRVLTWIEEEKITVTIFLFTVGVVLNTPPTHFVFTGMIMYGSILIILLHLLHRLYLKFHK